MGKIADTTFTRGGDTWTFEVYQAGASASGTLEPVGFRRQKGASQADILSPVLSTMLEVELRDPGKFLLSRIRANDLLDFELEIQKNGSVYFRGPLQDQAPKTDTEVTNPRIRLTFIDQLRLLKSYDWSPEEPSPGDIVQDWRAAIKTTEKIWHTIGETIAILLRPVTTLPVRTYWGWEHPLLSGKVPSEGHRLRPADLDRRSPSPTRMSALKDLLRAHNAYIVQSGGKYQVVDRFALHASTVDYSEWSTANPPALQSTGNESTSVTLPNSDIVTRRNGRDIDAKEYVYRARDYPTRGHVFPYAKTDNAPIPITSFDKDYETGNPKWDFWTEGAGISGVTYDSGNDQQVIDATGTGLIRIQWEQPLTESKIELKGYLDFTNEPMNGSETVPYIEFVRPDGTTFTNGILVPDGGNPSTETFDRSIDLSGTSVGCKLYTEHDPDGDGTDELNEVVYDYVRISVSKPEKASDFNPDTFRADEKFSVFDFYEGLPSRNNQSGLIQVYDGSKWRGVDKDETNWTSRLQGRGNDRLRPLTGFEKAAQLTSNARGAPHPLRAREFETLPDAAGTMIKRIDRNGLSYVPIRIEERPLEGERTITMVELTK